MWFLWGIKGCRVASSFAGKVALIKPLFITCTKNGIVATNLMRFDAVLDQVAASLPPSSFAYAITILHELLDAREHLGFCLIDEVGLARLARLSPKHEARQTPYIPPRIWSYQVSRLRVCLEAYQNHRSEVEACFDFCLDAYARNFGSLKQAISAKGGDPNTAPFQKEKPGRYTQHGPFKLTADRFGVTELLETWVGPFACIKGEKQISKLSQYLSLVSMAGLAYLTNFSLMRIEEAWNLRSDCLIVEKDERFGDIHILRGETTKTDADSDARWPVSPSAALAIDAMKHIASMRMRCARERDDIGLTPEDLSNPYLNSYQYEPWSRGKHKSYRTRPMPWNYQQFLNYFPLLLDRGQLTVQEDDIRIARLIPPGLDKETFKVGQPWRIGWHQLRRTGAVNMLSSDLVDESSLQLLLKHLTRVMTLYYGRNHARLALSEEARVLFLKTMYEEVARNLRKLSSPAFVSPLGSSRKESIVTFIRDADAISLEKAARLGKVGARRIRAGFCVNHLPCPYGGIEAIANCLGGEGSKGCPDLMLDTARREDVQIYETVVDKQLKIVDPNSPRNRSLQAEKRAIKKFHDTVQAQNS